MEIFGSRRSLTVVAGMKKPRPRRTDKIRTLKNVSSVKIYKVASLKFIHVSMHQYKCPSSYSLRSCLTLQCLPPYISNSIIFLKRYVQSLFFFEKLAVYLMWLPNNPSPSNYMFLVKIYFTTACLDMFTIYWQQDHMSLFCQYLVCCCSIRQYNM